MTAGANCVLYQERRVISLVYTSLAVLHCMQLRALKAHSRSHELPKIVKYILPPIACPAHISINSIYLMARSAFLGSLAPNRTEREDFILCFLRVWVPSARHTASPSLKYRLCILIYTVFGVSVSSPANICDVLLFFATTKLQPDVLPVVSKR